MRKHKEVTQEPELSICQELMVMMENNCLAFYCFNFIQKDKLWKKKGIERTTNIRNLMLPSMSLILMLHVLLQLKAIAVACQNILSSLYFIFQVVAVCSINCGKLAERNKLIHVRRLLPFGALPACLLAVSCLSHWFIFYLSCQQLYFTGDCCGIELEARAAVLSEKQYFILYITSQCIGSGNLVISHLISSIIYYAGGIVLTAAAEKVCGMFCI